MKFEPCGHDSVEASTGFVDNNCYDCSVNKYEQKPDAIDYKSIGKIIDYNRPNKKMPALGGFTLRMKRFNKETNE
jgi:hypothetical protein